MSSLQIGRLLLGPPSQWTEQAGDPLAVLGGAVVPGVRAAPQFQVALATWAADGSSDTLASRLTLRRQLRAALNNSALKLQGYLYVVYSDDVEQNGWYAPDQAQITDMFQAVALATGLWSLSSPWFLLGHQRTHREARSVWMKNLTAASVATGIGLYPRDQLGLVLSTDFSALPTLALAVLPHGASQCAATVSGAVISGAPVPTGRDGGSCQLVQGLTDLQVLSYERPESALNLSDVIVYDRRGLSSVLPETGNTNFLPNPNLEYDVPGAAPAAWAPTINFNNGGAVLTVITTQAQAGSQSMQVVTNGVSNFEGAEITVSPPPGGWQAGSPYTFSIYIKGAIGGISNTLHLGTGADNGTATFNSTAGFAQYSVTWTPVSSHSSGVTACFTVNQTPTATYYLDSGMVTSGNAVVTYIDGDRSGYRWAGTKGNSVSSIDPQTFGWQEVQGFDWPWSWLNTATPLPDCPVLDNGLVRVRYDGSNTPGFRVDVWSGSAYVEQGKMCVYRNGDTPGYDNTWVSAGVVEYTPDRAVIRCELAYSGDAYSRERIFITVQRGELGATFECYPALKAAGTQADCSLVWTPALNAGAADLNQSVAKIDSLGTGAGASWVPGSATHAKYAATAGTGAGSGNSGLFPGGAATLGAANFTASENWVSILRFPTAYNAIGPYQTTLAVLQAANAYCQYLSAATAYGVNADEYSVLSQNGAGYLQVQVNFSPTAAQQVLEAEAMALGANWTATADANSSGSSAAKTTQTSDVGAITQANWMGGFLGTYRLFIRAKSTVNATVYAITTGQATPVGDPVTIVGQATPTYSWYDLGEIVANNVTLGLHGWCNTAGFLMIDRVEAVLTQDRVRNGALYSGARDAGQSALQDSRMLGALVAR